MADYSSLALKALLEKRAGIKNENPYIRGASALGKNTVQYDGRNSTGEVAGASAIQGLLAGLMKGYGNSQVTREQGAFDAATDKAFSSESPIVAMQRMPELAEFAPMMKQAEYFNQLEQKAELEKLKKAQEVRTQAQLMQDGMRVSEDGNGLVAIDGYNNIKVGRAAEIADAQARAQAKYRNGGVSVDPLVMEATSRKYQELGMPKDAADALAAQGPKQQKQFMDLEGQVRKANAPTALEAKAQEAVSGLEERSIELDEAKSYLEKDGLTGFFDGTIRAGIDKVRGSSKDAQRLSLKKLRVDTALLNIAKTKGAISNREMELFLSPSPDLTSPESTWIAWIDKQKQISERVKSRLANGVKVAYDDEPTTSNSGSGDSNTRMVGGQEYRNLGNGEWEAVQ